MASLARLRRGIRRRLVLSGAANAAALLAAVAAVGILVARIGWQRVLAPTPAWALGLAPALAWGIWRARRETPTEPDLALHVDQRLALRGALLTAIEVGGAEGSGSDSDSAGSLLGERLARLGAATPRVDLGALLGRLSLAAAFLALVSALPPPAPPEAAPPPSRAMDAALAALDTDLADLLARGALGADAEAELRERLRDLEGAVGRGERPSWADLDGLEARIATEVAFRREALGSLFEAAREAAAQAAARSSPNGASGPGAGLSGLERAAQAAAAAGIIAQLDQDLAKRLLELARQGGGPGGPGGGPPGSAGFDPKDAERALRDLAKRLEAALAEIDPEEMQRLRELAGRRGARAGAGAGERGNAPGLGDGAPAGGAGPWGTGAPTPGGGEGPRGPGEAGGTDGSSGAAALPSAEPEGLGSTPVGAEVSEPSLGPERDRSPGREGAASTGEGRAAARGWLSPRQRAMLERFHAEPR